MLKIITRKEAKERGLKKYFLNMPCIHGHISERYVSSKMCITCSLIRDNNHYKDKSKTILTRRKNLYSLDVRNYISEWNKGNSKPFWKKIRLISDLVNTIKQNMAEDEMFGLLTLILSNVEDKYKNDNTKITEYKKRNQTTLKYK